MSTGAKGVSLRNENTRLAKKVGAVTMKLSDWRPLVDPLKPGIIPAAKIEGNYTFYLSSFVFL